MTDKAQSSIGNKAQEKTMHHIYTFFSSLYVNNRNHCSANSFFVSARAGCVDLCFWHMFPMPTKGFDLFCCAAAQQFLSISHVCTCKERHHPHPPPTYPISSMDHVCKNRSGASHVCKCKTRHYPHSPPSHLLSCMGHLLVSVGPDYTPTTPNNPFSAELRVAMTMPCSARNRGIPEKHRDAGCTFFLPSGH